MFQKLSKYFDEKIKTPIIVQNDTSIDLEKIKNFIPQEYPINFDPCNVNGEVNSAHRKRLTQNESFYERTIFHNKEYIKLYKNDYSIPHDVEFLDGVLFPTDSLPNSIQFSVTTNLAEQIVYDVTEQTNSSYKITLDGVEYTIWQPHGFIIPIAALPWSLVVINTTPKIDLSRIILVNGIFSAAVKRSIVSCSAEFVHFPKRMYNCEYPIDPSIAKNYLTSAEFCTQNIPINFVKNVYNHATIAEARKNNISYIRGLRDLHTDDLYRYCCASVIDGFLFQKNKVPTSFTISRSNTTPEIIILEATDLTEVTFENENYVKWEKQNWIFSFVPDDRKDLINDKCIIQFDNGRIHFDDVIVIEGHYIASAQN